MELLVAAVGTYLAEYSLHMAVVVGLWALLLLLSRWSLDVVLFLH